jgi:two-component system, NtrC family, nitrogen regulation sensor histidine kinase NtrY
MPPIYRMGLRNRIYLSMITIILFSLFVIGITTIIFFKNQNERYHEERLHRKQETVITSISYFLKETPVTADMDVVIKDFQEKMVELADVNNIDINIFNNKGDILMSSHQDMNDPEFFKKRVPENVLQELKNSNDEYIEHWEENDSIKLSTYAYILNEEGGKVAIINLPYLMENAVMQKDLKSFLITLVEIYLALLIAAGVLAYLLSKYITQSLRVIADKLKNIQISRDNERLVWKSNDEIGALVEDYNRMLDQLEESTRLLAQSEREHAWREMAKQVAHEIKNPLTPMKLSVQHLQRSVQITDKEAQEKIDRFAERMIEQIDTLTNIANEFSNFAKMPKANMDETDLKKVIEASIEVFANESVEIEFETSIDDALIWGDKDQLIRVFNNLIKNAVQACHIDKKPRIILQLYREGTNYCVEIIDNGNGIPDDIKAKIFEPNFTTKSTGMGLGLAMVKNIITQHKGTVSFETETSVGTTFFITIPKWT